MKGSWIGDLREKVKRDCQIVIVGNKVDVEGNREVSEEQGRRLAEEYNVGFY